MGNLNSPTGAFEKYYRDLQFERDGLFALVQQQYHPTEVLYPGCSIHLTPAFFFPHVVFVDQDPAVSAYFQNQEAVLELVNRQRRYRRNPYIRFISQDFTKPLPVPLDEFDLVLGLYTGGVVKACRSYLKIGGMLLTNNHQGDALEAARDQELALVAAIKLHKGKYRFVDGEPGERLQAEARGKRTRRYLRRTSRGEEYIDRESYYLFERIRPRG